jgi:hypothetical protein
MFNEWPSKGETGDNANELNLNDGVKANHPKFGTALAKIAGLS